MRPHDSALIDALEGRATEIFVGDVWRVTRAGRDALMGSTGPGRWSPGEDPPVLYTSLERDGALAEIGFRLSLEAIWPSRLVHEIHRIEVSTGRTLRFLDVTALEPLGVDPARWQGFDYESTRAIAAAAHFLEFDGLIVPSARAACANLVVFLTHLTLDRTLSVRETRPVDWSSWRKK
jgi:RES domain-containing protein